jgi:hypothetical protein
MGTYKNDYSKKEDAILWELHEIRHRLSEEHRGKSIEEINKGAKEILKEWKTRKKTLNKTA